MVHLLHLFLQGLDIATAEDVSNQGVVARWDSLLLLFILQLGCGRDHSVGALARGLPAFVAGAARGFGAIAFGLALATVFACQCNPLALRGTGRSRGRTRILVCRRAVHGMAMREGRGRGRRYAKKHGGE